MSDTCTDTTNGERQVSHCGSGTSSELPSLTYSSDSSDQVMVVRRERSWEMTGANNHDCYNGKTPNATLERNCRLPSSSTGDPADKSDCDERFQDSIAKRRRHAVYFHRPPVLCHSSCPHEDGGRYYARLNDSGVGDDEEEQLDALPHTQNQCVKCRLALAETINPDFRWLSENLFHDGLRPSSFQQTKAMLCTRLQSCKDIRVGVDEKWAIQEGSLVVSIEPKYTNLDCEKRAADEFELGYGDFYVVCRMYADFWALCAKVSFGYPAGSCHSALAFLPLCAVTLAANFNAFIRRCSSYTSAPQVEPRYPGNGLSVTPPERSHSLNASRQIFHGSSPEIGLPDIVYEACSNFSLEGIDMDFVPLDSTLENLLSELGSGRGRFGRRLSIKKVWHGLRSSESESTEDSPFQQSSFSQQKQRGERRRHRSQSSLSSAGQGLKRLVGMSPREQPGRYRRNIRDIISSGSGRQRYNSGSDSTESESWWK